MRTTSLLLLLGLLLSIFSACEKEEDAGPQPIVYERQLTTQPDWESEFFKESGIQIQFPSNYTGDGAVGFEGFVFNKTRFDGMVNMAYFYCNPLYCDPLGDQELPATLPAELPLEDPLLNTQGVITFDEHYTFLNGQEVKAHLYLRACEPGLVIGIPSVEDGAYARLFLADTEGKFREGLDLVFDYEEVEEVLTILSTLQFPE